MNDLHDSRNLTMLTDFYELTMANGYFKNHTRRRRLCDYGRR